MLKIGKTSVVEVNWIKIKKRFNFSIWNTLNHSMRI
jgi:hypothetical protein